MDRERRQGVASRQTTSVLDKPLSKGKGEVSLSLFAFLFSELVQYCHLRVAAMSDLENRLSEAGQQVGTRMLDILCQREKNAKRELKIVDILRFISSTVWKTLFGHNADALEKMPSEFDDEYIICEKDPIVNKFIGVPKELGSHNPSAFIAGIVKGILDSANFVTADFDADDPTKTVIFIKFERHVVTREAKS